MGNGWILKVIFEENLMKYFTLTIIASVEPGKPWTQSRLDKLEGEFPKKLNDYGLSWGHEYEG